MRKIKAVLLDLGGVVFQSTGISNKKINWKIISQLNHKYGYELNIGMVDSFPKFLKEYNTLTNQKLEGKDFLKFVFDTLEINKELIELLQSAYKIIIVSDNYRENIAYISKRYHFSNWAIQQIYSFNYKMAKSNPVFFQKLLKDITYQKEELIFIDDSQSKLDSAAKNGIQGFLYQNNEQIKEALKKITD